MSATTTTIQEDHAALAPPSSDTSSRIRTVRDRFVALAFCWADLLFELDSFGTIVFATGATQSVLGRPAEQLVGMRFDENLAAADRVLLTQILKIAEKRNRSDHAVIRLIGKSGITPPYTVIGYRLNELNRHFFLALRMVGAGIINPALARDGTTGLYQGDAFVEEISRRLSMESDAHAHDARMTLVSLAGMHELRGRLDDASENSLMAAIGACIRANSTYGDMAMQIAEDRYGLVHDSELNLSRFEAELVDVTRDADPEGRGAAVASATIDMSSSLTTEEDMARSLIYVINRFKDAAGDALSMKSLSSNLSSLMTEATTSVETFKRTVANKAFDLAFQPIIDVDTGAIHHFEALSRFHGAAKGESPYKQITFAEETGLIADFDIAVVQKAIEWLGRFPRNTNRHRIAINISGHSVGNERYVSALYDLLHKHAWVQDKLLFEITESSRMADLDNANQFIQSLRKAGHDVCLDDFGAGAASFQYLSTLDVDVVKLDGSAVKNAQTGPKGRAFLTALSQLCRSLAVATIAEMVDHEDTLIFVRGCGVDYVQGYLFGRPSKNIKDFDPLPRSDLFRAPRKNR